MKQKYESLSGLKKHIALEHSEKSDQVYKCSVCQSYCSQPHTIREHFFKKHGMDVPTDEIGWMVEARSEERGTAKRKPSNRPKRVYEVITCKCGTTNEGQWVFKRHVQNIHNPNQFAKFIKSEHNPGDLPASNPYHFQSFSIVTWFFHNFHSTDEFEIGKRHWYCA